MRYVNDLLVIRISSEVTPAKLQALSKEFADIIVVGSIEQRSALPEEASEPELADMPRLVFHFNRKHLGRLRQMIDAINATDGVMR
jgi:hypothetical protein